MLHTPSRPEALPHPFRSPQDTIGALDAETAGRLIAAASDVALVLDREGVIRDVAVGGRDLPAAALAEMVTQRWADTVTGESRHKVEEMLLQAGAQVGNAKPERAPIRWREINQKSADGTIPMRYMAIGAGGDGRIIALGRDLRAVETLQQRLLLAQQAMERDYARLRQVESRYRVLFQIASEPVLIVDQAKGKVLEANPAAGALLGTTGEALTGKSFAALFHPEQREAAQALLSEAAPASRAEPLLLRLADGRERVRAGASLFRQDGTVHVLVSLAPQRPGGGAPGAAQERFLRVLDRIPDALVTTGADFAVTSANAAFLDLTQLASAEAARGQPLAELIGRPGVDFRVLVSTLREHGWVKNFVTVARGLYGSQEDVEISAVAVPGEGGESEAAYGFAIRPMRRLPAQPASPRELPRTAEQLTELVGQVSLREIVAETTDVIERMCIEAALQLTGNNRASAAEMLGLSRQSLYTKLNRHAVGSGESEGG